MGQAIDRQLRGNELLLLNDPHSIWEIQSGSLALFTTRLRSGVAEGDRRYLLNLDNGSALFGIAAPPAAGLGMIAVALEPTQLSRLILPHPKLVGWVEGWIDRIGQLHGSPQPPITGLLPQMQFVSLRAGQIYQPRSIAWVRIQQGTALWMGNADVKLTAASGIIPVSSLMWLEAQEPLELAIESATALEADCLLSSLAQFHDRLLICIEQLAATEAQAGFEQFQQRQQLNQQVTQETIANLVAVLKPPQESALPSQTPLLIAAGAIGKAIGVPIQPPMQSEDLQRVKEPLEAIARASKLRLRRVLLRDTWWQKDGDPLLAYTRADKHPIALLPVAGSHYEQFDPQLGQRTAVNESIARSLDPIAHVFYPPLPQRTLQAIDLLKFALKGRGRDLISLLWTGIAVTLLGMIVPQATALLINTAIPNQDLSVLLQIGLGLLAVAIGTASFQFVQAIAALRLETRSDASLQAAVWDRLLQLRTTFFRQYAIGDLNARVSGISTIRRKLSGTTLQTLLTGSFSLLNLGLLFYYSAQLAGLALAVAVVIVGFTSIAGALLVRQHRALMELEGELFGIVVQLISGVAKLRIAGGEARAFAYWGSRYTQQLRLMLSTQHLEDAVDLFNTVLPTLTAIALFWLASHLLQAEAGLSIGTFLAFNVAFGTFISGVTNLSLTLTDVLDVIPLWQRSQPILAATPETDSSKADPGRLSGSVCLDRVTFRYRDDGAMILNQVSIRAQAGEFVAIVGASGSGKSTILRLLLGFETPLSGTVYFDGQDLAGLDVSAVRRQLGVVLQTNQINAGSIFENIAGGALITLEEAWTAAENSGLADDVRSMPMQMHTVISEGGSNLSGGQRQRLVIARALALSPRLLLFDEATSALDNRTQAIVSQSLDRLRVTRIVIAHRLSTIRQADRIYVLSGGQVVQQGKFDELANQPGVFAQLIRRQLT